MIKLKNATSNKTQKLKCLFGHHEFEIPNEINPYILMCKHCMRKGYHEYFTGLEVWYDYDKNGNAIHWQDSNGFERWLDFDEEGNVIHRKYSNGCEYWLREGKWVDKKPKECE